MPARAFRTVIQARQLQPILNIPEMLADQTVEVIVRPVSKQAFRSIQRIQIDTCTFKFDRNDANVR